MGASNQPTGRILPCSTKLRSNMPYPPLLRSHSIQAAQEHRASLSTSLHVVLRRDGPHACVACVHGAVEETEGHVPCAWYASVFRMNHRRTQSSGASSATATLSDMSCGFCRSGADCDIHGLAASTAASVVRCLSTSAVARVVDASFQAMAGVVSGVFHEWRCLCLCYDVRAGVRWYLQTR